MGNIAIKEIEKSEFDTALSLVWKVFREYEAPDYPKEGVEEFYRSIHDSEYLSSLRMLGAYIGKSLIGVIAARNSVRHIALFFVEGKYHRRGIGKMLFKEIVKDCPSDKMTVNSSPYAVPIYHRLGFRDTDCEQSVNGVRFTPMELIIC